MLSSTPAAIAAPAPPPAASTARAPNCAEPAKTIADITIGATVPMMGSASTPNEAPRSNEAREIGAPARIPALSPPLPLVHPLEPSRDSRAIARSYKEKARPEGRAFET